MSPRAPEQLFLAQSTRSQPLFTAYSIQQEQNPRVKATCAQLRYYYPQAISYLSCSSLPASFFLDAYFTQFNSHPSSPNPTPILTDRVKLQATLQTAPPYTQITPLFTTEIRPTAITIVSFNSQRCVTRPHTTMTSLMSTRYNFPRPRGVVQPTPCPR